MRKPPKLAPDARTHTVAARVSPRWNVPTHTAPATASVLSVPRKRSVPVNGAISARRNSSRRPAVMPTQPVNFSAESFLGRTATVALTPAVECRTPLHFQRLPLFRRLQSSQVERAQECDRLQWRSGPILFRSRERWQAVRTPHRVAAVAEPSDTPGISFSCQQVHRLQPTSCRNRSELEFSSAGIPQLDGHGRRVASLRQPRLFRVSLRHTRWRGYYRSPCRDRSGPADAPELFVFKASVEKTGYFRVCST